MTLESTRNTIAQIFSELVHELETLYEPQEATSIMQTIMRRKIGITRLDLALKRDQPMKEKDFEQLMTISEQLLQGAPMQYLLGQVDFLGCTIRLNRDVLIPRPETEELTKMVIDETKGRTDLRMVDIGTGSGCIAVALARHLPDNDICALDISQKSLELARINAISNMVTVDFQNCNILIEEYWKRLPDYDVIVSNPPYILEKEKSTMHINVVNYEPHIALFVPNDEPLLFYDKISAMATKRLRKGGRIYFEVNEAYGREVGKLLKSRGFEKVKLLKDLSGKDRFVKAEWN